MKFMKPFILVGSLLAISGCSLLAPVAEKTADVISHYCVEPQTSRALIRNEINQLLADRGHSIQVTCAGDIVAPD